jgi:Rrf2 family protein
MPLLSRKADYALVILSYLHHHPEGGSAREISDRFALSQPFSANILKILSHAGLVKGRRGQGGGYVLARPAREVCLCELLDALDEPFQLAECNRPASDGRGPICSLEQLCPVREAVVEVHRRIRDTLQAVTLADLFGSSRDNSRDCCGEGGTQYGLDLGLRSSCAQVNS